MLISEVRHAPNLIAHPSDPSVGTYEQYADQDAVYMSCIMNNAYSSDYILVHDTDEFFMPDFRIEQPLKQLKTFFRETPSFKGFYEFDRVEMARDFVKGAPPEDELLQSSFE